jgi:hypothetical protein
MLHQVEGFSVGGTVLLVQLPSLPDQDRFTVWQFTVETTEEYDAKR